MGRPKKLMRSWEIDAAILKAQKEFDRVSDHAVLAGRYLDLVLRLKDERDDMAKKLNAVHHKLLKICN